MADISTVGEAAKIAQDVGLSGSVQMIVVLVGLGIVLLIAAIPASVALRNYLKDSDVGDTVRNAAKNGVEANGQVIKNLQDEVAVLKSELAEMKMRLEKMEGRLANVKMVALDCYALATECDCETRERLLDHLKQIIKDA